jgi:hypothetical protein
LRYSLLFIPWDVYGRDSRYDPVCSGAAAGGNIFRNFRRTARLIIVITLAVGQVTPPYGLCLLIAGKIGNMPVHKAFVAVAPYIAVSVVVVTIIAFFPNIAFGIPKLLQPTWF